MFCVPSILLNDFILVYYGFLFFPTPPHPKPHLSHPPPPLSDILFEVPAGSSVVVLEIEMAAMSAPTYSIRRYPQLLLLLLLASTLPSWNGAAAQSIECKDTGDANPNIMIRDSAYTEKFIEALSNGIDFNGNSFYALEATGYPNALKDLNCKAALPSLNAFLARLHGDAAGPPPVMVCHSTGGPGGGMLQFLTQTECTVGVNHFNDNLNEAVIDNFVADMRAGNALDLDAPFLEKLAQVSREFVFPDDLAARVTAIESARQSSSTDMDVILSRLTALEEANATQGQQITALEETKATQGQQITALEETKATQGQKIKDLEDELKSKANQTYLDDELASTMTAVTEAINANANTTYEYVDAKVAGESAVVNKSLATKADTAYVDAEIARVAEMRRERAATPAARDSNGAEDGETPGSAANVQDDQGNRLNAGDSNQDEDEDEDPCLDQEDLPLCATMGASGCGSLFGQTNVTEVCPNLCNANCHTAAAETSDTDDVDATETPKSNSLVLGVVLSLLGVAICVGVSIVLLRRREQGRQRALTQARPAARSIENSLYDGDSSM